MALPFPGTELSQSLAHRKCSAKATYPYHVCSQAGLGTPVYSVPLRLLPVQFLRGLLP